MRKYTYMHGGSHGQSRTYAGQYMGKVMEDEGGKYAMYDDGEGNQTKAYFMEDPGQVGEFVPDNDYVFEEMDGKTFARLAPGFEDQRNPRERQIGKEVMEEGTQGASKIENLLEKLMDEGRGGKDGTRTYRYEQGGATDPLKDFLAKGRAASSSQQREVETNPYKFWNTRKGPQGMTIYIGDDGDDAFVKTADGQMMFIPDGRGAAVGIINSTEK